MIWSISWKNVWRSKLRSIVVISAVTIGIFGAVFSFALMNGMVQQKITKTVENETSHIQIHHQDFKKNNEPQYLITDAQNIIEEISSMPQVKAVSKRTQILAMASTSNSTSGVMVYGINPEDELKLTKIYTEIEDSAGTYFESDKKNQILISKNLADRLHLTNFQITDKTLELLKEKDVPEKILSQISTLKDVSFRKEKNFKDTLKTILGEKTEAKFEYSILTFSRVYKMKSNIILKMQDVNGELVDKAFKIGGIYYTGNGMFDEMFVFVKSEELTDLLGYNQEDAHEIAILLNNEKDIDKVVETLKAKYPHLQIESWGEIQPMIKMMQDWMGIYYYFFVAIILFALGFGIVNTMLMVVLERVKELGMLMAIGMNKKKVFSMIMLESVFLTITGGIVGIIFSAILTNITSKTGLDFSAQVGEGFEAMGFETIMYPSLEIIHYFGVGLLVVATGIIAAIYPARKALKLNPADAVRSDA